MAGAAAVILILCPHPRAARQLQRRVRQDDQQQRHVRRLDVRLRLPVLRAADRSDPDAVHDHRLRRVGAPVRGDQERGRRAAKGIWRSIFYSAIGGWILLLSFLFAVQDADEVSAGGGAVVTIFTQAMSSKWVAHRPAHLHRGPVLLHHGLPDERVAHAVRVQPRPRGARSPAVVDAELEEDARQRRHGHRGASRRSSRCPRSSRSTSTAHRCPIAFFAVVSIGVVGLYLCFAVPIYLRWKAGDSFPQGSWNLAATTSGWHRSRSSRSSSPRSSRMFPTSSGGMPWDPELRVEVRQLHPAAGRRRADPAVDLLARVGEELVHRADQAGRRNRRAVGGRFVASRLEV